MFYNKWQKTNQVSNGDTWGRRLNEIDGESGFFVCSSKENVAPCDVILYNNTYPRPTWHIDETGKNK